MTWLYLDTETVSLQHRGDHAWEVAWAIEDDPIVSRYMPHTLADFDPMALEVNHYIDRTQGLPDFEHPEDISPAGEMELLALLNLHIATGDRVTVVGFNPCFDMERLSLRWAGQTPWNYRALDLSCWGAAILGYTHPLGAFATFEELNERGWKVPEGDHTAGGDVLTAREAHHALLTIAGHRP